MSGRGHGGSSFNHIFGINPRSNMAAAAPYSGSGITAAGFYSCVGSGGFGLDRMFTQIAQITEHLYLSSAHPVQLSRLRPLGITLVVNATRDIPCFRANGVKCLQVPVDDFPFASIKPHFDQVADRIQQERRCGGKILVHCAAGVSRSASLVLAYLMKYMRLTLREAYHHVKECRPYIQPNTGFWRQLIEYEQSLTGRTTVKMIHSTYGPIPDLYRVDGNDDTRCVTGGASGGLPTAQLGTSLQASRLSGPSTSYTDTRRVKRY